LIWIDPFTPMHDATIVRSGKKRNSTGHPTASARAVVSFTRFCDKMVEKSKVLLCAVANLRWKEVAMFAVQNMKSVSHQYQPIHVLMSQLILILL